MREKKLSQKRKKQIILCSILGVVVLVGGCIGYMYNQINHVKIDKSDEALGITRQSEAHPETDKQEEVVYNKYNNDIINIALFGVDRRDSNDRGRADSTMILTVDFKHKKLKLSSLMRDMYLDIEGHGKTKFNHSYAYGGAPLTIKTINQTFGTDIRDYVTVDFFTLEKIIDEIGGVEIDVKEEEYPLVNQYMTEVANIKKDSIVELTHGGVQTLNGRQAVAYARIRYVGNGDFERTERQRKVLTQMLEKLQGINKAELPGLVMKILPYVETSLEANTIIDMGMEYLTKGMKDMEQDRFPRDGYWKPLSLKSGWYMQVDVEDTKQQLQDFIYEPESLATDTSLEENTSRNIPEKNGTSVEITN
ncbi:LytR family transcriptional regulator [Bacillus sp. M6-12]|uniref:LCP family protein n=1 Tax=Bacillus sp. M6-12 TaxID=2054166 RepID=UPI000C75D8A7|nr:LCP family protein [Bacillus sp. M6-12]PLS19141.1 LytR family transcriptional regulator [Bacillus sp. M6-12]